MHALRRLSQNPWLVAAAFLVIALAVYGLSLSNTFVDYDDTRFIVENPVIRQMSLANVVSIFTHYEQVLYVPLFFLSLQLDFLIGAFDPFVYHLHSLLLHGITSLLVVVLLKRLTKDRLLAIAGGLLFLIHPANVEAVAWASARKDLLAGFFAVASVLLLLRSHEKKDGRFLILSWIFFAASLLSKPAALALPIALPFLLWFQDPTVLARARRRQTILQVLPLLVLSIAAGVIGLFGGTQITRLGTSTLLEKLLMAAKGLIFHTQIVLWPTKLSVIYPWTHPISIASAAFLVPLLLVIAISAVAWKIRDRFPALLAGWGWFAIMLLPAFVNFRIGENFGDIQLGADRYVYLPMLGILLIVLLAGRILLERAPKQQRLSIGTAIVALVLAVLGWLSFEQTGVWKNTQSLFSNVIRSYPDAQAAHVNLGVLQYKRGSLGPAQQSLLHAIAIRPTSNAYANLGQAFLSAGNLNSALESFQKALELNPLYATVQLNIGVVYTKQDKVDEAVDAFRKTAAIDTATPIPWLNIGLLERGRGNKSQALEAYREALKRAPGDTRIEKVILELQNGK